MRHLALRCWTGRVGGLGAKRENGQESKLLLCINAGGVFLLSRLSKMVYAFFTILAILGAATWVGFGTAACETWQSLSFAVVGTPAEWPVYQNDEYRFRIKYPPDFDKAEVPNTLVTNGAAVIFVPAYDPSVNEAGERTNLISFSVTIGVSNLEATPEQNTHAGVSDDLRSRVCGLYPHFVWSCRSEGAVGNRYETEVFATTFAGKRYEITLFVHSANPGCYPDGTITIFDIAEIAQLFKMMVRTFSPSVEGAYRLIK